MDRAATEANGGTARTARQGFDLLVRAREACHADVLLELAVAIKDDTKTEKFTAGNTATSANVV
jgi:hypothetical protein